VTTAPDSGKPEKPGLVEVVISVLAAAFGVQSQKNRERDFKQGSVKLYIATGVVATVLFVLTIYGIVKLVLAAAS
jgi:hypothetical protein